MIQESEKAPDLYKETAYWARYRSELLDAVDKMEIDELRSGKYRRFASFGFNEFHPRRSFYNKGKDMVKLTLNYLFSNRPYFPTFLAPYSLSLEKVQEMAYHHCQLKCALTKSKDISTIETGGFGNPRDVFTVNGKTYTMAFLSFYIRYCFANSVLNFTGDEVMVELGSGSGHQLEILKKLYPNLTIICFDLPVPLFLCETYLSNVLGKESIVSSEETMDWRDLSAIKKGKVHFLGNWKYPLLEDFKFDLFWNAASFGEMEPHVVKSYLAPVLKNCNRIYLLQSRRGKKYVDKPITFEDYKEWLRGFELVKEEDVFLAHKKLKEESDYFQGVWKKI